MKTITVFILLGLMSIPVVLSAKPLMYVPSGDANDIVIIDLSTDRITGRIGELENAHGLSSSPNSEYLVAGSMRQIETNEEPHVNKPEQVNEVEHKAHHAGNASSDSDVANSSFISIVHLEHEHVMRRIEVRGLTHHTAVSPDGRTAVAVHSAAGGISVIDLVKMKVIITLQTGELPNNAVFNSDGSRLYVSNAKPGTISEIDTAGWVVKREITVGKEPEHIVITPDDTMLFVANVGDGTAVAVNLAKGSVVRSYPTGATPHGIDVSDDGHWLFVSSKGEERLSRIDLLENKTTSIELQPAPYHLEYVDSVQKLYVSSRKEPIIWVINPTTLEVVSGINLEKGIAHQMVVREK